MGHQKWPEAGSGNIAGTIRNLSQTMVLAGGMESAHGKPATVVQHEHACEHKWGVYGMEGMYPAAHCMPPPPPPPQY